MPNQILDQLKNQAQNVRGQVQSTREQLIGGSPGQTEIAGDMMNEVQSRMSERFDVTQERRPRVLGDVLNMDELPFDIREGAGGLMDSGPLQKKNVEFSGGKQSSPNTGTGIEFSG